MTQFSIDRRSLFKGAGALIVSIGIPGAVATAEIGSAVKPPLSPEWLDSWLAVKADGDVVAYFGKMDMGQGVDVAIAQIVADELDVPFERVNVVMGDTAWTVNQGGASGSTGIQKGGIPLRNAAAEARRVLVELASQRLGVSADRLEVTDGVVMITGDPARKLSYGELIGGGYFDLPMTWNGKIGNDLVAEGQAKPKPPSAYKIVGQSPPRFDVPAKVFGKLDYVTDIKVPGMLHGRMIRPPVAGALPVAVDEGSVHDNATVRVIRDKGFIGIVAEVEVDRRSGKVWGRKFTVAHDCGLIVNPDGLRRCIEGNVVQGTSRALAEEVAFDRAKVTSTDWLSYPILDITEAPEAIDIVLINRPELPPAGAGESSIRPVAAALANAVFDATGVRLRRAPLTPERLKPALA